MEKNLEFFAEKMAELELSSGSMEALVALDDLKSEALEVGVDDRAFNCLAKWFKNPPLVRPEILAALLNGALEVDCGSEN